MKDEERDYILSRLGPRELILTSNRLNPERVAAVERFVDEELPPRPVKLTAKPRKESAA